jgi:hypothetical protein
MQPLAERRGAPGRGRYQVESRPQETNAPFSLGLLSLIIPFLLWQAMHIETGLPTGSHVLILISWSCPSSTGADSPMSTQRRICITA